MKNKHAIRSQPSALFVGRYKVWLPKPIGLPFADEPDFIVSNLIPDAAWDEYFRMIFRDDTLIAGGGNFYVGLCEQIPVKTDLMPAIVTEPGAAGGYARQPIARSIAGWPNLITINGKPAIQSAVITFAAVGADFSRTFNRLFMTTQASGVGGVLFSYSGAFNSAILVTDGNDVQFQYEFLANQ